MQVILPLSIAMHMFFVKRDSLLSVLALLALWGTVSAEERPTKLAHSERASTIGLGLRVSPADGLIGARIREITLAQLLYALETRIGLRTKLNDPSMAELPISVDLRAVPLEHALPAILEGFSYAIYPADGRLAVSILSTPPRSRGKNRPQITASAGERLALASGEALEPQEGEPTSLDEFQAIAREEESAPGVDVSEEGDPSGDPSLAAERHQRYCESVVDRALAALASQHHHLKQMAINELASLEDPNATEALLQAVKGTLDIDSALRVQAVAALGRNAAEQGFTNHDAVDTLKRLAQGSDAQLKPVAKEALANMHLRR